MIRSANIISEYIRRFDSDFTQYFIIEFDDYIFYWQVKYSVAFLFVITILNFKGKINYAIVYVLRYYGATTCV